MFWRVLMAHSKRFHYHPSVTLIGAAGNLLVSMVILCGLLLSGCENDPPVGTGKRITSFEIKDLEKVVKPEKEATTIEIELTSAEAEEADAMDWMLIPTIKYSSGATIKPDSGTPTDFSSHKVEYTVTSSNKKPQEYLVYIGTQEQIADAKSNTPSDPDPNSKTHIKTFVLSYNGENFSAQIRNNTNKIVIYVAENIPCITKEGDFFTEIHLEVPSEAAVLPESGSLFEDFETTVGTPKPAKYRVSSGPDVREYEVEVIRINDEGSGDDDGSGSGDDVDGTVIDPIQAFD
jgi:hypothetical protein